MKFNSIRESISKYAVKTIFLGLLLLFFVFIVGSYFLNASSIIDGFQEGAVNDNDKKNKEDDNNNKDDEDDAIILKEYIIKFDPIYKVLIGNPNKKSEEIVGIVNADSSKLSKTAKSIIIPILDTIIARSKLLIIKQNNKNVANKNVEKLITEAKKLKNTINDYEDDKSIPIKSLPNKNPINLQ